ncbi:hypothetical protein KYJ98_09305 [Mammaliicoccus lentus]|uniref:hypothetical protein n=1 Tax=Mammaliicoccus lentus TaxID=42858 RepID=UPI001C4E1CB4|nr:hypothetical protein [Mammaliicoccus lentus]MBW0770513.1 hypothetical protein [Mammaliicoccus lentus]
MSKNIEIKMASDNGEQFYTRAHVDGLDGFEEYYQNLLTVADNLASFQADHIQDTGWMDYEVGTDGKNALYASDGFKCGIRQIHYVYGNAKTGQRYVTQKMIRVNIRNFANGQQVAQLPTGFMNTTQVFYSRSGSGRQPIMVEIRSSGAVNVYIDSADQSGSNFSNWIYAQFEWTE